MESTAGHDTVTPGPVPVARVSRALVAACALMFVTQLALVNPASLVQSLGFSAAAPRWWGAVTYILVHTHGWPLALNAAVLLLLGGAVERRWGSAEYGRYLLACIVGGWVAHVAFVEPSATITGAAAPALGATLGFAAIYGDVRHFRIGALALSTQTLATLVAAAVLATAATATDAPLRALAHAGGIVAGWIYLRLASANRLQRFREGVQPVPDESEEMPRAVPRANPRARRAPDDIVAQSNAAVARAAAARPAPPAPPGSSERNAAATLDRLLDKISAEGIDSLSREERRQLDDASRRLRDS